MIFTQDKPIEEVLASVADEKKIFLLACNGCAEACETGGEKALCELKGKLEEAGKDVTGTCVVDFLCNKVLVASRLSRHVAEIEDSDSVVVLTCGIGVQAVAKVVTKPVHPSANTISMGGLQGLWPSDERCEACGDCALDYTGGICPITTCAKSLLNGPCGGTENGKCEVDPEKDCGWLKIYDHLKEIGRLDNMKKIHKTRDHSKMSPSKDLRQTKFYDVEN